MKYLILSPMGGRVGDFESDSNRPKYIRQAFQSACKQYGYEPSFCTWDREPQGAEIPFMEEDVTLVR